MLTAVAVNSGENGADRADIIRQGVGAGRRRVPDVVAPRAAVALLSCRRCRSGARRSGPCDERSCHPTSAWSTAWSTATPSTSDRRPRRAGPADRHRHARDESPTGTPECFGPEASAFTRSRCCRSAPRCASSATSSGATTTAACSPTCTAADDGLFVNLAIIAGGYAQPLTIAPEHDVRRRASSPRPRAAEAAGLGLWGACGG